MASSTKTPSTTANMASSTSDSFPPAIVAPSTNTFNILPIELNQTIALCVEDDKDLVNFLLICKSTRDAVDSDGYSFWRRRFIDQFETFPEQFKPTGKRAADNAAIREEYQLSKKVVNVIDPVFQQSAKVKPKLRFKVGSGSFEKEALTVIKNLINGAFSNKKGSDDVGYESVNMKYIMNIVRKTNLLQILGADGKLKKRASDVSFLYAIQSVLAPAILAFDTWHMGFHGDFQACQVQAYADNVSAPIFGGPNGMEINMNWLIKNIQFWRSHFLLDTEPLCPAFEALEDWERPQFWDKQLSQDFDVSKLGKHWKGSYAFVERHEIGSLRAGKSGTRGYKIIQDHLNGEEDPDDAFQNMEITDKLDRPDAKKPFVAAFKKMLDAADKPAHTRAPKTRAQKKSHHSQTTVSSTSATQRALGLGMDKDEAFQAEFWFDSLPKQCDLVGYTKVQFMKYYYDDQGDVDFQALWAHSGVMLPGSRIMIGRWFSPSDGHGPGHMYSGPFILWNVNDSMVADVDDDQSCVAESDGDEDSDGEIANEGKGKKKAST